MKLSEVTVSYLNNDNKRVKETYAIEAVSFADAEKKAFELCDKYGLIDFGIEGIKCVSYNDVFTKDNVYEADDDNHWYAAKVVMEDENAKKHKVNMLVLGKGMQNALSVLKDMMHGTITDWTTVALRETNIYTVSLS